MKNRFSKRRMLRFLEARVQGIARRNCNSFKRGDGTYQLGARNPREDELVRKAIEYGRLVEADAIRQMVEANHDQIVNEPNLQ